VTSVVDLEPEAPSRVGARGFRCRGLVVWPAEHVAYIAARKVTLTKGESAMLQILTAAEGRPVCRAELAAVRSRGGRTAGQRSIDSRIYWLRRKLKEDARSPRLIVTVFGVGYAIGVDVVIEGDLRARPPGLHEPEEMRQSVSATPALVGERGSRGEA
jgi:DNA-binding response OmpR family regulator